MRFSRFLTLVLVSYLLTVVGLYWSNARFDTHIDIISIFEFTALVLVCIWLLNHRTSLNVVSAYNARLALFLFLFYAIPFLGYVIYPKRTPYLMEVPGAASAMNMALLLTILGALLVPAGFEVGYRKAWRAVRNRYSSQSSYLGFSIRGVQIKEGKYLVRLAVVLALCLYSILIIPGHYVSTYAGEGTWWRHLVSFEPVILLGTVFVLENRTSLRTRTKFMIVGPILAWQVLTIIQGSRSSLFELGLIILSYFLLRSPSFRIPRKAFLWLFILAAFAVITYPIGYAMRFFQAEAFKGQIAFSLSTLFSAIEAAYSRLSFEKIFIAIGARLSYLDQLLLMMRGPLVNPSPYVGILHDMKALVDAFLPRSLKPFPNVIDSSSTFPIVYMGIPVHQILDYQKLTMPWQVWGLVYQYFGWFFALPGFFFAGFLSGRIVGWLPSLFAAPYRVYVTIWVFLLGFTLIDNFGLDTFFAWGMYNVSQYVVVLILMRGALIRRLRARSNLKTASDLPSSQSSGEAIHPPRYLS